MQCKGKTKNGERCKVSATISGYCVQHLYQKINRVDIIKKLDKQLGWKK